jgi:hypothetical protein
MIYADWHANFCKECQERQSQLNEPWMQTSHNVHVWIVYWYLWFALEAYNKHDTCLHVFACRRIFLYWFVFLYWYALRLYWFESGCIHMNHVSIMLYSILLHSIGLYWFVGSWVRLKSLSCGMQSLFDHALDRAESPLTWMWIGTRWPGALESFDIWLALNPVLPMSTVITLLLFHAYSTFCSNGPFLFIPWLLFACCLLITTITLVAVIRLALALADEKVGLVNSVHS